MTSPLDPKELTSIVDEVFRRVAQRLGAASPGSSPASSDPATGQQRAACGLAHGVAARPPATRELPAAGASSPWAPPAQPSTLVDAGACRLGSCKTEPGAATDASSCSQLAGYLDHTLLKPEATDEQVRQLCEEAKQYRFATVCVNSAFVPLCASLLRGSGVLVCSVVGFPLGAMSSESKAFETRHAIAQGAQEIDMVINVGKLQQGDFEYVFRDIEAVVKAAHGTPVKVILETALLNDEQKVVGCALSKAAGSHFVKTSTGFAKGGATAADVALMRRVVGPEIGVKASGGIRDCATAREMVEAGANRIGASASVKIVSGGA